MLGEPKNQFSLMWRNRVPSGALVGILALAFVPPAWGAGEQTLGGDWVGGFERDGAWVYLQVHLRPEKERVKGTYDLPLEFINGKPLANVRWDSPRVRFEMPRAKQVLAFAGRLEGPMITGNVADAGREVPFHLDRTAKIKVERYTGIYELGTDHFLHIRAWDEFDPGRLQAVDFGTGQF